jgi:hypothetical protein
LKASVGPGVHLDELEKKKKTLQRIASAMLLETRAADSLYERGNKNTNTNSFFPKKSMTKTNSCCNLFFFQTSCNKQCGAQKDMTTCTVVVTHVYNYYTYTVLEARLPNKKTLTKQTILK